MNNLLLGKAVKSRGSRRWLIWTRLFLRGVWFGKGGRVEGVRAVPALFGGLIPSASRTAGQRRPPSYPTSLGPEPPTATLHPVTRCRCSPCAAHQRGGGVSVRGRECECARGRVRAGGVCARVSVCPLPRNAQCAARAQSEPIEHQPGVGGGAAAAAAAAGGDRREQARHVSGTADGAGGRACWRVKWGLGLCV